MVNARTLQIWLRGISLETSKYSYFNNKKIEIDSNLQLHSLEFKTAYDGENFQWLSGVS